jgi:hypothetical protein
VRKCENHAEGRIYYNEAYRRWENEFESYWNTMIHHEQVPFTANLMEALHAAGNNEKRNNHC